MPSTMLYLISSDAQVHDVWLDDVGGDYTNGILINGNDCRVTNVEVTGTTFEGLETDGDRCLIDNVYASGGMDLGGDDLVATNLRTDGQVVLSCNRSQVAITAVESDVLVFCSDSIIDVVLTNTGGG